ncbi:MAG TPA: efflux transporter outer membrane subunit [Casimicrobiaceae bacterium]|nr:efflux transporter outer membrane subunit [Casimicrobiaceae bacterium]
MRIGSNACSTCAWVLGVLLLTGCAVGPEFSRPQPPESASYSAQPFDLPEAGEADPAQTLATGKAVATKWWSLFQSPELDQLLERTVTTSPTLQAAKASVAQAQHLVAAAQGGLYPQVDVTASAQRQRTGSVGGAGDAHVIADVYSIGPEVTLNTDLFGGIRRTVEQQAALAEYQRYQLAGAYLALTGDVVVQAIDIAAAREEMQAVREIVAIDERNLELVQIAQEAGKVARVDVLAAQSQLASDRALIPPIEQQIDVARDALAVLAGRSPGEWRAPDFDFSELALPTELPVTLPSALVRERPDILASEAQLHAANAAIGIATAHLYPDIVLSASWTEESATLGRLFSGSAGLWSLAAELLAPVFHGGTLEAQRQAAIAAYAAQLGSYHAIVAQGFGQVADGLHALAHDADALAAQQSALATAQATLELTQESFAAGQASFVQLLQTQRLYQQARLGYSRAKGQRYVDAAQLFVVMGGDWTAWLAGDSQ